MAFTGYLPKEHVENMIAVLEPPIDDDRLEELVRYVSETLFAIEFIEHKSVVAFRNNMYWELKRLSGATIGAIKTMIAEATNKIRADILIQRGTFTRKQLEDDDFS